MACSRVNFTFSFSFTFSFIELPIQPVKMKAFTNLYFYLLCMGVTHGLSH